MKIHFVGIGGIGMSALAQLHAMAGDEVTGSDRLINNGFTNLPVWDSLKKLGVKIYPQDGSGIDKKTKLIVLTSAIEPDNIEIEVAKKHHIPFMHRSELLAKHVKDSWTVAISGTSGKSTTTAMLFEILRSAGKDPSVITGGVLLSLQAEGYFGNVYKGKSKILVIEADESDGTLVNYHPKIGVMLNLAKDHKELDVLEGYFKKFSINCDNFIINEQEDELKKIAANYTTFGIASGDVYAKDLKLTGHGATFSVDGQPFILNLPGEHNVKNAMAAIAAAKQMGVSLKTAAKALENFKGVYRRFNTIGHASEIEVIDDFAHNPHKVAATLKAAHLRGKRVLAFFQPHAFASVQLLLKEFIEEFSKNIRKEDTLWLGEIYYAGGTVPNGISSKLIYDGLKKKSVNVKYMPCRNETAADIAKSAKPGDVILVLGARDPTLTAFAQQIFQAILQKTFDKKTCRECLLNTGKNF
ncbi:MAG: UDP-N-acetylmuramate--L-alanine ligase [Elusimicrobiota bacterium]|jgi:UDP-N-acetylmuramate--alanine ligase|nr:UDP-N-acetylmuramate--L-alanine ligase [Elusimicrobiota bacterium]